MKKHEFVQIFEVQWRACWLELSMARAVSYARGWHDQQKLLGIQMVAMETPY